MLQMFVPSVSRPTRQQVEKEIQKIYPDAKVMSFLPKELEPGEPTVMVGEAIADKILALRNLAGKGTSFANKKQIAGAKAELRNERGGFTSNAAKGLGVGIQDFVRKTKPTNKMAIEKDPSTVYRTSQHMLRRGKSPTFKKTVQPSPGMDKPEIGGENTKLQADKRSTYPPTQEKAAGEIADRKIKVIKSRNKRIKQKQRDLNKLFNKSPDTTTEEFVKEDDMKGMSVKSGHKRPTKSGAGMTAKGVAAYRRRNI